MPKTNKQTRPVGTARKARGQAQPRRSKTTSRVAIVDVAVAAEADPGPRGKLGIIVALLRRSEGATITALSEATGWQAHSVRGAVAGALKKKHGFSIANEKTPEGRVYRIVGTAA